MSLETQLEIRGNVINRLRTDLLGPSVPDEVLQENRETKEGDSPLGKYLLGILYPSGVINAEEDDSSNEGGVGEEDGAAEPSIPMFSTPKPSSIGLSFAIIEATKEIDVVFRYGIYQLTEVDQGTSAETGKQRKPSRLWKRIPTEESVRIELGKSEIRQKELPGGARGEWLYRKAGGYFVVSVFLRNTNPEPEPASAGKDDPEKCLFQPEIIIKSAVSGVKPIVSRANQFLQDTYDPDLESYRLLYRDKPEFGVGHGCAVSWDSKDADFEKTAMIQTEIFPVHTVATTEAKGGLGLAGLSMDILAKAPSGADIRKALEPLLTQYSGWISTRRNEIGSLPEPLHKRAHEHLADCENALKRMSEGLALIEKDTLICEAFQFANRAMELQRRKSLEAINFQKNGQRSYSGPASEWRPFQIAFILLNLKGIADPKSPDREIADLLWFPTGGGKTEAYLGLSAFTLGLRRLRHTTGQQGNLNGDGGVTVLMRYTLRLLTIQQFQRAAALICACECLRKANPEKFGRETFSIGLWVGGDATPNNMDSAGNDDLGIPKGAKQILEEFDPANEPPISNPVQIRSCPWCGETIKHTDYKVHSSFTHLQIRCPNKECDFHGSEHDVMSGLPTYLVDEDIYLRCPSLLIGTVDKFARLPWDEKTKALFGRVDRKCGRHGYLPQGVDSGHSRHNRSGDHPATQLPVPIASFVPPELIIQDELHLITGPLGSLMGVYEAAIEYLCSRGAARPKVVASTATIRRFQDQISALFDRSPDQCKQFPPPGLIAGDSFFAAETKEKPGRQYIGICAPGKSMKTSAVRLMASILHSGQMLCETFPLDDVDPYWTAVYYFNSLRELGGALRLVDDDIKQRLIYLANREGPDASGKRRSPRLPDRRPELTSRIPAKDIAHLLKEMEKPLSSKQAIDVMLCTNMISVGVDIQRFGLMVLTGQPKTSAEYIQATSRVGRQTPGLIFTLYNWSRPRDISHYERFNTFHSMMYRHVEASSITPYSPRARDKALHGAFVALLRLTNARLADNAGAQQFDRNDPLVKEISEYLLDRVKNNDPDEYADAKTRLNSFIDGWVEQQVRFGDSFTFRSAPFAKQADAQKCLIQAAEDSVPGDFPMGTLNSLREVEKTAGLYYKNFRKYGRERTE